MRIGIVGTGGMGNVHTRHYANVKGVEITCFDQDDAKGREFAERHGIKSVDSFEGLLDVTDALDVCLPTYLHRDYAMKAIRAGKGVLVEKPMCRTVAECREVVSLAEKEKAILMVGHVVRNFPELRKAHDLVASGAVGRVASARMRRGGKAPMGSDGWFRDIEKSGGVLLDLAIHDFDWLRWTMGEVTQVYSRSVRLGDVVEGAEFTGDYALTTLSFESGAVAHVEATWMDPSGYRSTVEVSGSEGVVEFDSREYPTMRMHTEDGTRNESHMAPQDDPYFKQLSGFVGALRGEHEVPVTGLDGLRAVAIAEAALESAKTGKPVKPELE